MTGRYSGSMLRAMTPGIGAEIVVRMASDMGSYRRIIVLVASMIVLGASIVWYTLARSIPVESVSAAPTEPATMHVAATAVSRQIQGTLTVQRADLATRIAAIQTPGPAAPAQAQALAAAAPPAASAPVANNPVASPAALGSPTAIPPDPLLPAAYRFYRGINLGGAPEIIEGRPWLGDAQARAEGFVTPNAAAPVTDTDDPLSPPTDPATARMLQSTSYVAGAGRLRLTLPVPNGTYAVYVYVIENYQTSYRSLDIAVEENVARTGWSAARGGWEKLGPYVIGVGDGALDVEISATAGDPSVAGLAIFRDEEGSASPAAGRLPYVQTPSSGPQARGPQARRHVTECAAAEAAIGSGCKS